MEDMISCIAISAYFFLPLIIFASAAVFDVAHPNGEIVSRERNLLIMVM